MEKLDFQRFSSSLGKVVLGPFLAIEFVYVALLALALGVSRTVRVLAVFSFLLSAELVIAVVAHAFSVVLQINVWAVIYNVGLTAKWCELLYSGAYQVEAFQVTRARMHRFRLFRPMLLINFFFNFNKHLLGRFLAF